MISCNKKLKSAAKGFLCGMLLYLFMIFMTGHFTFFRLSEIPTYLLRRLPYGIMKCFSFGVVGYLISLLGGSLCLCKNENVLLYVD